MKLINVSIMDKLFFGGVAVMSFLCCGDNCNNCAFKFNCYTNRGILEVKFNRKNLEPVEAWLNKQTKSTTYRQGTDKFKQFAGEIH